MNDRYRRLAASAVLLVAASVAEAAAPKLETYDDRIARRLATIDQKTYEIHRRCYGWQEGIYALLNRLKAFISAQDAKALDDLAARYAPTEMFGVNEGFLKAHKLNVDQAAGDQAWGKGRLEWGAQALQPPDAQYTYFQRYGQVPPDCDPTEARIEAVRTMVWQDEFSRDLYGKAFIPPYDPR
jgi:hypothetical protein